MLDLTVQNEAFQTDDSIRQSLNSFVEVLSRDINGQQIRKGEDVTAVLRLTESRTYMLYIGDIYAKTVINHVRNLIVFTNSKKKENAIITFIKKKHLWITKFFTNATGMVFLANGHSQHLKGKYIRVVSDFISMIP